MRELGMYSKMLKTIVTMVVLGLGNHLVAVDPDTVIATINVGVTPAGIAITPDNRFVYVANNNNYGITGQDCVTVIDVSTNLPVTTIFDASFSEPYTITINAAGTKAYVTNSYGTTITIIDIATNTVTGTITGFNGPSGMVITPDGTTAYVNNYGAGNASGTAMNVNIVNLLTNTITGSITVGLAPAAVAISPDGAYVYSINYVNGNPNMGTMSVINTTTNTVIAAISGFSGPFAITITPDGHYAYVTNFGSNNFEPFGTTVSVVDLTTYTIIDTITLGIQPSGIAITPDGKFVYATNYNTLYAATGYNDLTPGQGTVNIIDTAINTVIPPTIAVGQAPANIAITPNGTFAYVSNYISNTVNAIALPTFSITGQGRRLEDSFLLQQDLINKITWSVTGSSLPISYQIYQDAQLTDLIATISPTGSLQYFDHNQIADTSSSYYLVGINAVGTNSNPVQITVSQPC